MRGAVRFLFVVVGALIGPPDIASAAPPASCAGKFAGTWTVRVLATGQTYPSVLSPNGTGLASCPMCTPTGTWTCSGNTLTVFVNGIAASQTLSADGRTLTGPCCVSTRVGRAPTVRVNEPTVAAATAGAPKVAAPTVSAKKSTVAAPTVTVAEPKTASPTVSGPRQSSSCSDITGLNGGGSGPGDCAPSTGVPTNAQRQIDQALASLQAARTVKQSDRSPSGRAVAALQFRNAAAAFRQAGDLALAAAAESEALALERSAAEPPGAAVRSEPPSQSMQMAARPSEQPVSRSNACPPLAPAENWQGTPNADYCANANCVDRGSAFYGAVCFRPSSDGSDHSGANSRQQAPKRFTGHIAPDVQGEVLALGDAIAGMPEGDSGRDRRVHRLERLLADHRVKIPPILLACLQPLRGSDPPRMDVPLRWHPYHIKKEAIDRSGLCDGVPEGNAKEACREAKYGEAVMWAEPEIAGQCRTANAPAFKLDAVAECAKRKFLSAWDNSDGILPAPTPANWVLPAECGPRATAAKRKQTLRDLLSASLAATDQDDGGSQARPLPTPPPVATAPAPSVAAGPAPSLATSDDDEAYCNYMAREVVRGELTPSPATAIPPGCRATIAAALALRAKRLGEGNRAFAMDAGETDREIARLMASPPTPRGQIGAPVDPH